MRSFPADLLQRYGGCVPRYTSYPPATSFTTDVFPEHYAAALAVRGKQEGPIGAYVHIPFCKKLCLYCGCSTVITQRQERADDYVDLLEREARLVRRHLGDGRALASLHLGGGSPNFLAADQLAEVVEIVSEMLALSERTTCSIEINPEQTSPDFLVAARALGFSRISFGVQDLEPAVLRCVNRDQAEGKIAEVMATCRALGFASISYDLMYGLPLQTPESMRRTVRRVAELGPDRIALFGYAHVPWMRPHQRALPEAELPALAARAELLVSCHTALLEAGYQHIGLDHYARAADPLAAAARDGTLSRSFQGYDAGAATDVIGLGASAISNVGSLIAQNAAEVGSYRALLAEGRLPIARGVRASAEDLLRRDAIMSVMCSGKVEWAQLGQRHGIDAQAHFAPELAALGPMADDGLLTLDASGLEATGTGRFFVRTIAHVFDRRSSAARGAPAI